LIADLALRSERRRRWAQWLRDFVFFFYFLKTIVFCRVLPLKEEGVDKISPLRVLLLFRKQLFLEVVLALKEEDNR
jgi:hypothetical protein